MARACSVRGKIEGGERMLIITHAGEVKRYEEVSTSESVIGIVLDPSDDPDRDNGETRRAIDLLIDEMQLHCPWSYRNMVPGADALLRYVYDKAYKEPEKEARDK
jgi:hypothetical protein